MYSDYDAMVDAFVKGDIDLAWNGPLGYVKIKRPLDKAVVRLGVLRAGLAFLLGADAA